jgi:hypothetical protein
MTREDHEAIQELLAGHILHALDEDEAREAESLLANHVPTCAECMAAFEQLSAVAGELALAAGSRRPPHLLGLRIRRETSARRAAAWVGRGAVAAATIVLVGVLSWNFLLTGRVRHAEDRQARAAEVLTTVVHPASRVVPMAAEARDFGDWQLSATFIPGRPLLYIFGSLPSPTPGRVYQVWLVRQGRFHSAATFVPESDAVWLKIPVDPTGYDGVLITEEPGSGSRAPSEERLLTANF